MTKFARLNIIWQCGAFSTAMVLDAEHYKSISDTFAIIEDEHPGLLFFKTFLKFANKCIFRILCGAQRKKKLDLHVIGFKHLATCTCSI